MDREVESREIIDAVKADRFLMRTHANQRGLVRNISRDQVIHVANHLIEWKWQEDKQTHLFVGYLEFGVGGGFTAVKDQEMWIVTVFRRKLKKWQAEKWLKEKK